MLFSKASTYSNDYRLLQSETKKTAWDPESWQKYAALQQPIYNDQNSLNHCLQYLKNAPKLVTIHEIEELKHNIHKTSMAKGFLFQAGDCAEQFKDCSLNRVKLKLNELSKQKEILELGLGKEVYLIGRIAGQFAKPRSEHFETKGEISLPAFRGDIINSNVFNLSSRLANPVNLIKAYHKSKRVLNYIRNFSSTSSIYTSHEALLLPYESALTRYNAKSNCFYNASSHFLWVGERTRQTDSAHIKYLSGVTNPIGIKFSENISTDELIQLTEILNPKQENGKIILIPRMGNTKISSHLPIYVKSVKKEGLNVTWMCDPMHGNTEKTENSFKTRKLNRILDEVIRSVQIHKSENSYLGGLHLETAPDAVTECTGGKEEITNEDLKINYQSACDPRLNPSQTCELLSNFIKEYTRNQI